MRLRAFLMTAIVLSLFSSASHAATIWDESVNGDLSGTQGSPTSITLGLGTNAIVGNLRTSATTDNQDFVALTVPAGMQFTSDILAAYSSTDQQGFTGFQIGSSFVGSTTSAASYAGYSHFGTGATNGLLPATNLIGVDLLPLMADNSATGTSAGASGFTNPLGPGTYTFLIQQTGSAATSYEFDFTTVPEPASVSLLAVAAIVPLSRRSLIRRKSA